MSVCVSVMCMCECVKSIPYVGGNFFDKEMIGYRFKLRISRALGLDKRCADVGITEFTTELALWSFEAVPGFENGRVYDC